MAERGEGLVQANQNLVIPECVVAIFRA